MRLRRLESEVIRDAMLAVSGLLDPAMGGPRDHDRRSQPDGMVVGGPRQAGRAGGCFAAASIWCRGGPTTLSLLTVFDQPLVATNCAGATPRPCRLQSLVMLNDAVSGRSGRPFAGAYQAAGAIAPTERRSTPRFAWRCARNPTPPNEPPAASCSTASASLRRTGGKDAEAADHLALAELCLALLNTSEFLYAE